MGTGSPEDIGGSEKNESSQPAGLAILVVAAVAIVTAIAVAALVAANRGAPEFEEGSPEAAVQGYLDAVLEGDEAAAFEFLSADLRDECSVQDIRNEEFRSRDVRVTLRSVTIDGGDADVEVTIIEDAGGGLFGADGFSYEETITLIQSGGDWVISRRPWPIFFCEGAP